MTSSGIENRGLPAKRNTLDNATLGRFFSVSFQAPFVIAILAIISYSYAKIILFML
jgi:hypothetical protein